MEKYFRHQDDVSSYDNEESEKTDLDLEKATIEHEFSIPWDDSDLVLVVEDQKLHVHRAILRMTSPVFKVMLSSDFKEKDAREITLPGKKVDEFVDFLRQVYPLLDSEITLKNIRYIYRLADEYQMPKVKKDCRMFLSSVRKTKKNAMDMLLLAQDLEAEEARQQCYDVLKKMSFTALEHGKKFSDLDRQSMNEILLPLVKQYHKCMTEALPELLGTLDGMMYLWRYKNDPCKMNRVPKTCSKHNDRYQTLQRGKVKFQTMYERIKCDECRVMFKQMARNATGYTSSSETYLSENNVNVLEEMMELTKDN